jgi:hypothetical protein
MQSVAFLYTQCFFHIASFSLGGGGKANSRGNGQTAATTGTAAATTATTATRKCVWW